MRPIRRVSMREQTKNIWVLFLDLCRYFILKSKYWPKCETAEIKQISKLFLFVFTNLHPAVLAAVFPPSSSLPVMCFGLTSDALPVTSLCVYLDLGHEQTRLWPLVVALIPITLISPRGSTLISSGHIGESGLSRKGVVITE